MLHSLRIFIAIVFMVCCVSCTNSQQDSSLIVGTWQGAEWLVAGKPSANDVLHTSFSFDARGAYTHNYSGNIEQGAYKVENEMLFTTPQHEQEIMVKIAKLTKDSLVFSMNRGGQEEQLTLVKK